MIKLSIVFSIFFLSYTSILAQWQLINPLPFDSEIASSFFIDENTGWITTNAGEIFKTNDGGNNWTRQYAGNGQPLITIYIINENLGFAAGWNGLVLKTTDNGKTWIQKINGVAYFFTSIYFVDSTYGWVVGYEGKIYATTDGGENWIEQDSKVKSALSQVQFFNHKTGYVVGWNDGNTGNRLLKTTDGGQSWLNIYTSFNGSIEHFYFLDEQKGFGTNGNNIDSTNDGGLTWNICYKGDTYSWFNSIVFSGPNDGWAVGGFNNLIVHSSDGGLTWKKVDTGINEPLFDIFNSVFFASEDVGWVFNSGRAYYKTTDKGVTWIKQSKDSLRDDFYSIQPVSENTLFALAGNRIMKSEDSGFNWLKIDYQARSLNKIKFQNPDTGWVVGTKSLDFPGYDLFEGILLKTTDSGNSWTQSSFGENSELKDIFFVTPLIGWITGRIPGIAYKTTDGGTSWSLQGKEFAGNYSTLLFLDESYGFVAGDNFYRTTDGGFSWNKQSTISNVASIYFFNKEKGFAVCHNSYDEFYKTVDGGITWVKQNISSGTYLNKIIFIDSNTGYIISNNSVFITTDAGDTWIKQVTPYHWVFSDISFFDKDKGWVVGSRGFIMYTENGGITTNISHFNRLPGLFNLFQNYPNPFNPTTNIGFRIAKFGFVSLKVYDILGREVATLVNEEKHPGSYEVKFNGSSLSSGIYFYKLQTGNYTSVKRMILMK